MLNLSNHISKTTRPALKSSEEILRRNLHTLIFITNTCSLLHLVQCLHLQQMYQLLWLDVTLLRWLGRPLHSCRKLYWTTEWGIREWIVETPSQYLHQTPIYLCKTYSLMQCTLCQWQASTRVEVQVNLLMSHFNCKVTLSSWTVTLQCVIVLTPTSTSAAVIQFSHSLGIALSRLWQISPLMWMHSF